jgi:D-alanyl-D-alanine carboxypeptidase
MEKKILHIFMAVVILIVGFYCGLIAGKKFSALNKIEYKSQTVDTIAKNNSNTPDVKSIDETNTTDTQIQETIPEIIPKPEVVLTKEEIREKKEASYPVCPKPVKEYDNMFSLAIGIDLGLPDENYIPINLRGIDNTLSTKDGICLIKEARDSFESMLEKAHSDGYNLKASSGFRTYDYQNNLYTNEFTTGNTNVDMAIAKAGHSEHQLGVAVDVTGQSIKYEGASKKFDGSKEAKWMEKNAIDYGFIESYPFGKEDVTGYMYEPWHYRYVGIDNAKQIIKSGKTINEFFK